MGLGQCNDASMNSKLVDGKFLQNPPLAPPTTEPLICTFFLKKKREKNGYQIAASRFTEITLISILQI